MFDETQGSLSYRYRKLPARYGSLMTEGFEAIADVHPIDAA